MGEREREEEMVVEEGGGAYRLVCHGSYGGHEATAQVRVKTIEKRQ